MGREGIMTFDALYSMTRRELTRFCADQNGAAAIEYALIAAGVGAAVAATVWSLGSTLKTAFYDKLASILP
jgi:pilus assembly protein Flp/PilA